MAKETLTPTVWIEAGLSQLSKVGADALRAEPLARHLKATKGSFYWHFKDVPAYHDALLDHWKTGAMESLDGLKEADGSTAERLIQLGQSVQSDSADPALRAWAQSNDKARKKVSEVDDLRMKQLGVLMTELGNDNEDFAKAAYGSLVGLRQMETDDGAALIAFASLVDMVLSSQ